VSGRRKLRSGGLPRVERCDRCGLPAAHALAVPPVAGESGYEVLSCSGCWPSLRIVVEGLGATIEGCTCGRC